MPGDSQDGGAQGVGQNPLVRPQLCDMSHCGSWDLELTPAQTNSRRSLEKPPRPDPKSMGTAQGRRRSVTARRQQPGEQLARAEICREKTYRGAGSLPAVGFLQARRSKKKKILLSIWTRKWRGSLCTSKKNTSYPRYQTAEGRDWVKSWGNWVSITSIQEHGAAGAGPEEPQE